MPDVFAWTQIGGRLRVINIDGGAADATTDFKPPSGKRWYVIYAYGYHDDTSSRSTKWKITDGTDSHFLRADTLAASVYQWLGSVTGQHYNQVTGPIILTNSVYAELNVVSIGSGKKGYIRALVVEVDE